MYCPICFNQSLSLKSSGKGILALNGKQSNFGVFLFNTQKESAEQIQVVLKTKMDEFLQWYSSFENISPISTFEVYSSDFCCDNNCKLETDTNFSLIGPLISEGRFHMILQELTKKYKIPVALNRNSI